MREIRLLTLPQLRQAYDKVFTEAFPPSELKPLRAMEELLDQGLYHPLALFDGGEPIGYMCLWGKGKYLLIDYLCVPASARNGGIGAQLLRSGMESFPAGTVFIGEVEAPTGDAERDVMINRRLGFYRRCGARVLNYDTGLFGVHFKTICWSSEEPDQNEVLRQHREIYSSRFTPESYARFIQIPLREGEELYPLSDWIE